MIYHGQNSEDKFLWEYFEANPPKRGYKNFVDIGANDGITLSNTHLFALNGWGGLCIEPDKRAFERLQNLYKDNAKIKMLDVAVGENIGMVKFWQSGELLKKSDIGLVSTSYDSEKARFQKVITYKESEVSQVTWQNVLEQHPIKFALLSIDAEGADWAILQQIDLTNAQAVCIEWNGKQDLGYKFTEYCSKFGLKPLASNIENLIFAR